MYRKSNCLCRHVYYLLEVVCPEAEVLYVLRLKCTDTLVQWNLSLVDTIQNH